MTRKRVEELEEREAELLKSYNSLSTSLSRPKLSRKKKRRRDCMQVDTSRLQVCSRLGAGGSGTEVYSCNVDGAWSCSRSSHLTPSSPLRDSLGPMAMKRSLHCLQSNIISRFETFVKRMFLFYIQ